VAGSVPEGITGGVSPDLGWVTVGFGIAALHGVVEEHCASSGYDFRRSSGKT